MSERVEAAIDAGLTVDEALAAVGFTVTSETDEGRIIHCCGEPVRGGSGIFGTDTLKCTRCGASMWMFTSPHINGGLVFSDEMYARIGARAWHVAPSLSTEAATA